MIRNKSRQEFIRYLAVGFINTLFGFGLIITFQSIFNFNPYLSNALSFWSCHLLSFQLHKKYTFRVNADPSSRWKFSTVILISWLVNILTLRLCLALGFDEYIAQAFGISIYVITSFTLHKLFTFSRTM